MTIGKARPPALEVEASARAGDLRFRREPGDLHAQADGLANSGCEARRGGLPSPVQAMVTYTDVTVLFRSAAWLADDPGCPR